MCVWRWLCVHVGSYRTCSHAMRKVLTVKVRRAGAKAGEGGAEEVEDVDQLLQSVLRETSYLDV